MFDGSVRSLRGVALFRDFDTERAQKDARSRQIKAPDHDGSVQWRPCPNAKLRVFIRDKLAIMGARDRRRCRLAVLPGHGPDQATKQNLQGTTQMKFSHAIAAAAALTLVGFAAEAQTLDAVKSRGHVLCGVSQGLPGFSNPDDKGNWTGIDVDVCRAVERGDVVNPAEKTAIKLHSCAGAKVVARSSWTWMPACTGLVRLGPMTITETTSAPAVRNAMLRRCGRNPDRG